jgi:hypothetical protein
MGLRRPTGYVRLTPVTSRPGWLLTLNAGERVLPVKGIVDPADGMVAATFPGNPSEQFALDESCRWFEHVRTCHGHVRLSSARHSSPPPLWHRTRRLSLTKPSCAYPVVSANPHMFLYSNYQDFGGLKVPMRISQRQVGMGNVRGVDPRGAIQESALVDPCPGRRSLSPAEGLFR